MSIARESTVEPGDANLPAADRGVWPQASVEAATSEREATTGRPEMAQIACDEDRRSDSQPLTAEVSRVHVTVPREFFSLLEQARSALSHARPGASDGEILVEGLKALVDRCAKRRGLVKNPHTPRPEPAAAPRMTEVVPVGESNAGSVPPRREYIPARVRRAVWERDGGRCSFPLESGGVCGSTFQLELDHITPVALGGTSRVGDLRVACRRPEVSPRSQGESRVRSIEYVLDWTES